MQLKDYIHVKDITNTEFARQINYTNSFLSDIINFRKKCGRKFIEQIVKATDGAVTKEDMHKLNMKTEASIQKRIVEKQAKEQSGSEIKQI